MFSGHCDMIGFILFVIGWWAFVPSKNLNGYEKAVALTNTLRPSFPLRRTRGVRPVSSKTLMEATRQHKIVGAYRDATGEDT